MYVLLLSAKCVLLVVSCLFVCLEAVGGGGGGVEQSIADAYFVC